MKRKCVVEKDGHDYATRRYKCRFYHETEDGKMELVSTAIAPLKTILEVSQDDKWSVEFE